MTPEKIIEGTLRGEILEEPAPIRVEGFPFESLFYIPKAIPRIKELLKH